MGLLRQNLASIEHEEHNTQTRHSSRVGLVAEGAPRPPNPHPPALPPPSLKNESLTDNQVFVIKLWNRRGGTETRLALSHTHVLTHTHTHTRTRRGRGGEEQGATQKGPKKYTPAFDTLSLSLSLFHPDCERTGRRKLATTGTRREGGGWAGKRAKTSFQHTHTHTHTHTNQRTKKFHTEG